jgi:NAD(P)-dependent dehydrogenase (short-subunit alcohol dehydrogenase family)
MIDELAGKTALVTGSGSPTGIGFACARALVREGARVAVTSTSERIHERADELDDDHARGFVADLTDRAQVHDLAAAVTDHLGQIDVLVNNAGMMHVRLDDFAFLDFLEIDDATWDLEISMNLATAFNVTRAVASGMVERRWGRIVMVSSVTGTVVTNPGSTGYGTAKAGMEGLMRASRWSSVRSASPRTRSRPGGSPPRPLTTARWTTGSPRRSAVPEARTRSRRRSRSSRATGRATSRGSRSSWTAATRSRRSRARGELFRVGERSTVCTPRECEE